MNSARTMFTPIMFSRRREGAGPLPGPRGPGQPAGPRARQGRIYISLSLYIYIYYVYLSIYLTIYLSEAEGNGLFAKGSVDEAVRWFSKATRIVCYVMLYYIILYYIIILSDLILYYIMLIMPWFSKAIWLLEQKQVKDAI